MLLYLIVAINLLLMCHWLLLHQCCRYYSVIAICIYIYIYLYTYLLSLLQMSLLMMSCVGFVVIWNKQINKQINKLEAKASIPCMLQNSMNPWSRSFNTHRPVTPHHNLSCDTTSQFQSLNPSSYVQDSKQPEKNKEQHAQNSLISKYSNLFKTLNMICWFSP